MELMLGEPRWQQPERGALSVSPTNGTNSADGGRSKRRTSNNEHQLNITCRAPVATENIRVNQHPVCMRESYRYAGVPLKHFLVLVRTGLIV